MFTCIFHMHKYTYQPLNKLPVTMIADIGHCSNNDVILSCTHTTQVVYTYV